MLQAAAAASSEVGAGRLHAVGRGREDGVDGRPPVTPARLGQRHPEAIAGQPAAHEHDVAVRAAHTLAAEGEVVDDELNGFATFRLRHDVRPL